MSRRYVGIDPGKDGGVAWVHDGNGEETGDYGAFRMPATRIDIARRVLPIIQAFKDTKVLIEKVGAMPKQGVSSTFKFGYNAGFLTGILVCGDVPWEEVAPRTWQRAFGLIMPAGTTPTVKKNRHKERAQQLFPKIKHTHATSDAILIAEYCRRFERGML